jgi:outer membrane immunogenic protein
MRLSNSSAVVGAVAGVWAVFGISGAHAQSERFAGTYGGLHGGYSFAAKSDEIGVRNFATNVFVDNYGPLRPSGLFGGVQIGHNFSSGGLILGIEADVSAGKISSTHTETRSGLTVTGKGDLNALSTLRAKAGVLLTPTTLAYVTGGLTVAKYDYQVAYAGALNGTLSKSDTVLGWTGGAGLEFALDKNWSFKTEALYLNLQKARTINDGKISTIEHLQQAQVRLGLNYKF